jgi:diguanylate cyclase (GGDEF)-like protein
VEIRGIAEPEGWDDPLTGLEGPAFWRRVLIAEIARAAKYEHPLTVVIAELEGLEDLGAAWGDGLGQHALREAAQCLRRASRASDYCARIGPTRFGVVLTETDEISAINFVERVREAIPRSMPRGGEGLRFSFGWASPKTRESANAMVGRAERRLVKELLA